MCLAVPMKVMEIKDNTAKVEISGTQRLVGLDIIEPKPKIGDYVIVHAGFAISVMNEEEAKITINDLKELFGNEIEIPE